MRVTHPRGWRVRLERVGAAEAAAKAAAEAAAEEPHALRCAEDALSADAARRGMLLHGVRAGDALTLRTRRDGDRFAPHWRHKVRAACSAAAF